MSDVTKMFCGKLVRCYRTVMSMSVDDSGTQRHLLDDSVLNDAVCTSSDSSLPGSGNIPGLANVCLFVSCKH